MIKDEKDKVKVAESPEEALWEKVKSATEERIKSLKDSLIVENELLKIAKEKLKK